MTHTKRRFKITITYFKPSGKLYTTAEVEEEFSDIANYSEGATEPVCYMYDVVDWVEALRDQAKLPGLQSGKWEGFILVDCPEYGYPHLIKPE